MKYQISSYIKLPRINLVPTEDSQNNILFEAKVFVDFINFEVLVPDCVWNEVTCPKNFSA